jgi:hypothetical protein
MKGLDERTRTSWRSSIFQGIGRQDPGLALRLAKAEGMDGTRFLAWPGQTADEKLASFIALRQWHANDEGGRAAIREAIKDVMLHRPFGQPVVFEDATGWIEGAGVPLEDIRFLTDRSTLDLSYYMDAVETGKWIDWLWRTFPEDWTRARIDGLLENRRTRDAALAWLADQTEERARQIRGDAGGTSER